MSPQTAPPISRRQLLAGADTTSPSAVAGTRTVTDEFGEVEVPVDPQRDVFMDTTTFGNALV